MTERGDESIRSRPPTFPDEPMSEVTGVCSHREDEACHVCKMFVAGDMPDPPAIRPSAFLAPDVRLSVPTNHPDPSERDSKELKTELPWEKTELTSDDFTEGISNLSLPFEGKGYCDNTENLPADAIEPVDWSWYMDPRMSSDDKERIRRARLEDRLKISLGYGVTHVSHAGIMFPIFEIFSVSIHWYEKENVGGIQYHLYGNVFVEDCGECCLTAMKRSPQHPFVVSNGDNLPLYGLDRCLWCDPYICLFVCLMGHRFESGGKCCEYKSPVLIKRDLTLRDDIKETFGSPVERAFDGADGNHFFKIHYSVMIYAFVVGVEVRLVCPGENRFGKNMIRICGTLGVHWRQFENCVGGGLRNYTILLLDTEQQDSLSLSSSESTLKLRVGECFPIWRRKLAVPSECDLVFDANIKTDSGEVFMGQKTIRVEDYQKFFTLTFEGGMLNMQITLLNYFCH